MRRSPLSGRALVGGGAVRAGFAAGVLCLGLVAAPAAFAADSVFWSTPSGNTISFASLSGSGGADLSTSGATVNNPQGVAVDAAAGRIYWANVGANKISFANLDGSGGGDLVTTGASMNMPVGVAIDPGAGRIYWANSGAGGKISFANLDGTGGGDVFTGVATVSQPAGVAVDPAAGRIYWANTGGNKISFAKLNGSGGGDLFTGVAIVNLPEGVAVDPAGGRIFWANAGSNQISFAYLNGSGGGDLLTAGATVNVPVGVAIDVAAGRIYWANYTGNKISFANLSGGGGGDLTTTGATQSHFVFPLLLQVPSGAGVPVVSGNAVVGSTLSCSQGTWGPDLLSSLDYRAPQSFAYSWSENGTPIAGATSSSITAGSPGSYVCQVTASNHAGPTAQSSAAFTVPGPSPPPPPPPAPPTDESVPQIAGTTTVGQSLSASTGMWSGTAPISFTEQWQRCDPGCSNIAHATGSSYKLAAADLSARMRVIVTASNSVGSAPASSSEVGPIAPSTAQIKASLLRQITPYGKAGKIAALLNKHGYLLSFMALTAGRVVIDWYYLPKGARLASAKPKPVVVAVGKATFSHARTLKLTIKLTASGKRLLKHSRRLKLTAKGTFTPTGKQAVVATKKFMLTR
jgi:DNA-binding beta-propeller fold protein YncE